MIFPGAAYLSSICGERRLRDRFPGLLHFIGEQDDLFVSFKAGDVLGEEGLVGKKATISGWGKVRILPM